MNDLPNEISHLFMVHKKLYSDKTDILNFCSTIQDVVEKYNENQNIEEVPEDFNEPLNNRGSFNYNPDSESDSDPESMSQKGRQSKKLTSIPENSETRTYDYLDDISNSSQSSHNTSQSSQNSSQSSRYDNSQSSRNSRASRNSKE